MGFYEQKKIQWNYYLNCIHTYDWFRKGMGTSLSEVFRAC